MEWLTCILNSSPKIAYPASLPQKGNLKVRKVPAQPQELKFLISDATRLLVLAYYVPNQ